MAFCRKSFLFQKMKSKVFTNRLQRYRAFLKFLKVFKSLMTKTCKGKKVKNKNLNLVLLLL